MSVWFEFQLIFLNEINPIQLHMLHNRRFFLLNKFNVKKKQLPPGPSSSSLSTSLIVTVFFLKHGIHKEKN